MTSAPMATSEMDQLDQLGAKAFDGFLVRTYVLLRAARPEEARLLEAQFNTLPCLSTSTDLWQQAIGLGQACRQIGRTVLSLEPLDTTLRGHAYGNLPRALPA